jgi:hypothetical protein
MNARIRDAAQKKRLDFSPFAGGDEQLEKQKRK